MVKNFANGFMAICISALLLPLAAGQCLAGYAKFDCSTDTIQVAGNSTLGNTATLETRILLTCLPLIEGTVYSEYVYGAEDKDLNLLAGGIKSFAAPVGGWPCLEVSFAWQTNTWYHIAFAYDGAQERIYINGRLVGARAGIGDIWDRAESVAFVGANVRPAERGTSASFIGLIDTLRISTTARYYGESFVTPTGDLESDAYTQLLYNFNEAPGSTTITDLSGNDRNGTLGVGFVGATSPEFVPEPSCALVLLGGVGSLVGILRLNRR